MKKNKYLQSLGMAGMAIALLLTISTQAMNKKQGDEIIASIETTINKLKPLQKGPSDIEKVYSPAVQKERGDAAKKSLVSIMQDAKKLDSFVATLPSNERVIWQNKQAALLEPAKNTLRSAITENITSTWQQHGKALGVAALQAVQAGVTSAGIGLALQGLQMGTGNLLALDTNALLVAGLSATAIAALKTLGSTDKLLGYTAGQAAGALIVPSSLTTAYSVTVPLIKRPLTEWVMQESFDVASKVFENAGGFRTVASQVVFPKAQPAPSNELVLAALPKVQAIIGNNRIASILTEVGFITAQSAAVGGLLYLASAGYSDVNVIQSVGYAVLTGVTQGALASIASLGNKVAPGSIVTVALAPAATYALGIAGATPQALTSSFVQAAATESINVFMETTKKSGGILPTLKKGKDLLGAGISKMNSAWSSVSGMWNMINSPMR